MLKDVGGVKRAYQMGMLSSQKPFLRGPLDNGLPDGPNDTSHEITGGDVSVVIQLIKRYALGKYRDVWGNAEVATHLELHGKNFFGGDGDSRWSNQVRFTWRENSSHRDVKTAEMAIEQPHSHHGYTGRRRYRRDDQGSQVGGHAAPGSDRKPASTSNRAHHPPISR